MRTTSFPAVAIFLTSAAALSGEVKVEKDVAYGPHERNVMDIYWKPEIKNDAGPDRILGFDPKEDPQ